MDILFTQNKNQIITLFEKAVFFSQNIIEVSRCKQFIIFLHLRLIYIIIGDKSIFQKKKLPSPFALKLNGRRTKL